MANYNPTRRVAEGDRPFIVTHRASLVLAEGKGAGNEIELQDERVTMGRSEEAHVTLDDERASRFHVVLALKSDGYELRDLHSTNGTLVNGQKVETHTLQHGDSIRIGSTTLRYLVEKRSGDSPTYEIGK